MSSCIDIHITPLEISPVVSASDIVGVNVDGSVVYDLSIDADIINDNVVVIASLVCDVSRDAYLNVSPTDFVWLNESNDYSTEFEVYSNVEWIIE